MISIQIISTSPIPGPTFDCILPLIAELAGAATFASYGGSLGPGFAGSYPYNGGGAYYGGSPYYGVGPYNGGNPYYSGLPYYGGTPYYVGDPYYGRPNNRSPYIDIDDYIDDYLDYKQKETLFEQ